MVIRLNIDKVELNEKPKEFDGRLRKRLCNVKSICEVEPETFIECVRRGRSFTPAVMTGTSGETWQSQQIICSDIDNALQKKDGTKEMIKNPLKPGQALSVMNQHGITPYFMYNSFSNSAEWPRYRIVVILDKPIQDRKEAENLGRRFTAIFNRAAKNCADTTVNSNASLFYGSTPDCVILNSGKVTELEKLRALPTLEDIEETPAVLAEMPTKEKEQAETHKRTPGQKNGKLKPYNELLAQLKADIQSFDLAKYINATTNSKPVKRGNALYFNPCPLCGHRDDFQVTGHIFRDWSASGDGAAGTIIDYLIAKHGIEKSAALDKFKFEIMKYDREEWRKAWLVDKFDEREYPTPEQAQSGANNGPNNASGKMPAEQVNQAENAIQDATAANAAETLPGLLVYDDAVKEFQEADDEIIEIKSFPEFSKVAKIKKHSTVAIAADTGGGKSSLAINIMNDLNKDYPCIYFNLEMDRLTVLRRLVAIQSGLELDRIEGYKNDPKTAEAVNLYIKAITERKPLQIVQDSYLLEQIDDIIKRSTAGRKEPTMVFVDHSLLVELSGRTAGRYDRFTEISERLRKAALKYNIILFVLLQQNRDGKKDETERPKNSSLKESGSWENDATHICFLWYDPTVKKKKLLLTKNRGGDLNEFTLNYWSRTQTYTEAKEQNAGRLFVRSGASADRSTRRGKAQEKLQDAYNAAVIATSGRPTLRAIAEAADVTTATVKGWIKEYGGCIVDGVTVDPAGIDTKVEYTGFVKLTPADNALFDYEDAAGRREGNGQKITASF